MHRGNRTNGVELWGGGRGGLHRIPTVCSSCATAWFGCCTLSESLGARVVYLARVPHQQTPQKGVNAGLYQHKICGVTMPFIIFLNPLFFSRATVAMGKVGQILKFVYKISFAHFFIAIAGLS